MSLERSEAYKRTQQVTERTLMRPYYLTEWATGVCTALVLVAPRGSIIWFGLLAVTLSWASAAHAKAHSPRLTTWLRSIWAALLPHRSTASIWLGVCFLGFAVASTGWSADPAESFEKSISLTFLFVATAVASGLVSQLPLHEKRQIARGAVNGVLVGLIYLAVEVATGGAIRQLVVNGLAVIEPNSTFDRLDHDVIIGTDVTFFNRHLGALSIIFWPILFLLAFRSFPHNRIKLAVIAYLICLPVIFSGNNETAKAIFIASGFVFLAAWWAHRLVLTGLAVATIGMLLFSFEIIRAFLPVTSSHVGQLPPTAIDRVYIWQHTVARGMERPLLGHGANATPHLNRAEARTVGNRGFHDLRLNKHAHNWAVQVRFELGLVGAVLAAAFAASVQNSLYLVPVAAAPYVLAFASVIGFKFVSASSF